METVIVSNKKVHDVVAFSILLKGVVSLQYMFLVYISDGRTGVFDEANVVCNAYAVFTAEEE